MASQAPTAAGSQRIFPIPVKGLGAIALEIFLHLLLAHHPLGFQELVAATGHSKQPVRLGLAALAERGLVQRTRRNFGWQANPRVRRLFAKASLEGEDPPLVDVNVQTAVYGADVKSLEEVNLTVLKEDSSSSDSGRQEFERILRATEDLFGEPVLWPRGCTADLPTLLAVVAEAWEGREKLRKPARIVYANLRSGCPPSEKYFQRPHDFLPASFLAACGLADPGSGQPEGEELEEDEVLDELEAGRDLDWRDPSLDLPVGPPGAPSRTAAEAWQSCLGEIKQYSNPALFDRYLLPAELLHFDPQSCLFTVGASDEYAAQLLAHRFDAYLARTLAGICNREAALRFVVRPNTEGRG